MYTVFKKLLTKTFLFKIVLFLKNLFFLLVFCWKFSNSIENKKVKGNRKFLGKYNPMVRLSSTKFILFLLSQSFLLNFEIMFQNK